MFQNQDIIALANGEPPSQTLLFSLLAPYKKLVAIDGGLKICEQFDLQPDLILGDFDSTSKDLLKKYDENLQVYAPDQMKPDLEKALEYLFSLKCQSITVLGATGLRIDHTLTNIHLLCRYPVHLKFETEKEQIFAISSPFELNCRIGQTLSLIPFGEAHMVETQGLKWNLEKQTLDKQFVGISNLTTQEKVFISFNKGDLIVCLVKD